MLKRRVRNTEHDGLFVTIAFLYTNKDSSRWKDGTRL